MNSGLTSGTNGVDDVARSQSEDIGTTTMVTVSSHSDPITQQPGVSVMTVSQEEAQTVEKVLQQVQNVGGFMDEVTSGMLLEG